MWPKRLNQSGQSVFRLLLAIVLIAGAFLIFTQRQALADHVSVWQYDPSPEVASMADRVSMSERGRFLFYASQPELLEAASFNSYCADHDPQGATLGCYRDGLIYIYDIDDDRLDGIKEVTAAHEMLHAAYARLSAKEKERINQLIDQAYEQLQDEKLEARLKLYDKSQPGTRYVELHAIIGTEYAEVTGGLEAHYGEFFDDRQAVTALHKSYAEQFTAREARAAEISQELNSLADRIESGSVTYNRDVQTLSRDIGSFNQRASRVSSEADRSRLLRERDDLISRTAELETRRGQIDGLIARYNELVKEYNSIATEVKELNQSIDSKLAPTPRV